MDLTKTEDVSLGSPESKQVDAVQSPLKELFLRSAAIVAEITEMEGEVSPALERELNELSVLEANKVDGYHFYIERFEAEEKLARENAAKFELSARRLKNAKERLEDRFKDLMVQFSKEEVAGNLWRYKISETKGKLVVTDPNQIPTTYMILKPEPDRALIKSDLMEGKEVPGCGLEKSLSLRVSTNTRKLKGNS